MMIWLCFGKVTSGKYKISLGFFLLHIYVLLKKQQHSSRKGFILHFTMHFFIFLVQIAKDNISALLRVALYK